MLAAHIVARAMPIDERKRAVEVPSVMGRIEEMPNEDDNKPNESARRC